MRNNKKSLELQTKPAFEPSQIARMAPEDASFLIECLMNRLQEEFEQKQEEIYKHAGAFKGQDLTIPLGSKTIKIQGGTGEVGHISEKFIENEQKAAVGKFRLKEPYWRHRIFDDDYDNDGKPDSWIGSPTVKDAAKILANAIPGAGPLLSFLIDAGDALYSGLVEGNWSAAARMLGGAAVSLIPGGGSLLGNIASSFAKAGIKEAFSIIGEAASNGWDFKKIRLGEHLKGVAISGAVSSFNAWAGAKLGINYQKPGLGDALKMTAVNFGSRTLSFALNEGFKAIEQGTNYRFNWGRAARQLGANAALSVVETGVQVGMSYWDSAMAGVKAKGFFAKMGLRAADMLVNGASTYITGFAENVAAAWVEKGNELTIKDVAQSSGMAMREAWVAMGETDREQVYLGIRGLIKKGIRLIGKGLSWLGNKLWEGIKWAGNKLWQGIKWAGEKLWQGVKAAGRWAWSAITNAPKVAVEVVAGIAAQFVHNKREEREAVKTAIKRSLPMGSVESKFSKESINGELDEKAKLANEIKESLQKKLPKWALEQLKERGIGIDKLAEAWAERRLKDGKGSPKSWKEVKNKATRETDKEFYKRHPEMKGKKLDPKNPAHKDMIKEWNEIYKEKMSEYEKEYGYLKEPAGIILFRNTVEGNTDYKRVRFKELNPPQWVDEGGVIGWAWNRVVEMIGLKGLRVGHYKTRERETWYYSGVYGTEDIVYITYDGTIKEIEGYKVNWTQKSKDPDNEVYEYPTYEGRYELEYKKAPTKNYYIHVKGREEGVYIHQSDRSEGCLVLPWNKAGKSIVKDIEDRLREGQRIDVIIKNIDKRSEIDKELRPAEGADR